MYMSDEFSLYVQKEGKQPTNKHTNKRPNKENPKKSISIFFGALPKNRTHWAIVFGKWYLALYMRSQKLFLPHTIFV